MTYQNKYLKTRLKYFNDAIEKQISPCVFLKSTKLEVFLSNYENVTYVFSSDYRVNIFIKF